MDRPIATITICVLVVIAAGVGGAVVITDPQTLNFKEYLEKLGEFAIAVGILGIGRGLAARGVR